MAKQSIVKVIKAKPGNKPPNYGKYANLPMECNTKGCENEATVHFGTFANRHKLCWYCFGNAPSPTSVKATNARKTAAHNWLKSIGVTLN